MKRKPPQLDKPYPRHRPVSRAEAELWRALAEGKAKEGSGEKGTGKAGGKIIKTAPKTLKPSSPLSCPKPPALMDQATSARLLSGKTPVEATLDLHGHTQAAAHAALVRFIEEAQARGQRTVLVITGKGKNGQDGILKRELPRWLAETPLRERIIAYDNAGPRHGGGGAWYLRIRK